VCEREKERKRENVRWVIGVREKERKREIAVEEWCQ